MGIVWEHQKIRLLFAMDIEKNIFNAFCCTSQWKMEQTALNSKIIKCSNSITKQCSSLYLCIFANKNFIFFHFKTPAFVTLQQLHLYFFIYLLTCAYHMVVYFYWYRVTSYAIFLVNSILSLVYISYANNKHTKIIY